MQRKSMELRPRIAGITTVLDRKSKREQMETSGGVFPPPQTELNQDPNPYGTAGTILQDERFTLSAILFATG